MYKLIELVAKNDNYEKSVMKVGTLTECLLYQKMAFEQEGWVPTIIEKVGDEIPIEVDAEGVEEVEEAIKVDIYGE